MTQAQLDKIEKITKRLKQKKELSRHEANLILNNLVVVSKPCLVCGTLTKNRGKKGSPICIDCSH